MNSNDFYLGIPFTRDINLYGQLILENFNNKYMCNLTWNEVYDIIETNKKSKNCLLGFFNFKLKILIGDSLNHDKTIEFIKKNYVTP